jgi:peptidase E
MKTKPSSLFLIAGGPQATNNELILGKALELAGNPKPAVAYIGTASEENKTFFRMIKRLLIGAGAGSVTLVPIVKNFNRTQVENILGTSDLIFISGGEVAMGMDYLREHDLIPLLTSLYNSGKPISGVSAGAIMLCRSWMRWRDENDDNTVQLLDCLGFAPLLCDVHAEEDGWEEMKRLLGFFPEGTKGYGIPAGGALIVTPAGKVTDIGNPPVLYMKKRQDVVRLPKKYFIPQE